MLSLLPQKVPRTAKMPNGSIAIAFCIVSMASPAAAWTFTPGQPCVLTHETDTLAVKLTYDPTQPLYSIALTRAEAFSPAATFSMQFQGAMPIGIGTDRHQLSPDGKTVTVTDSGFGNVLNGLQFNFTVTATLGEQRMEIPLIGAADPVAAFRACKGPDASV